MSKQYIGYSSPQHKTATKFYSLDADMHQPSPQDKNNIEQCTKIKQALLGKKTHQGSKQRLSEEDAPTFSEDIYTKTGGKKVAQCHRTAYIPMSHIQKQQESTKTPYFLYNGGVASPKIAAMKLNTAKSHSKSKNNLALFKKNSAVAAREDEGGAYGKNPSPLIREKKAQEKKNNVNSPRLPDRLSQQIRALKRSKYLQSQYLESQKNEQNSPITLKDLKQTISTASSNKSTRTLKISQFELGRDLGKGKFGNVRMAKHKKTGLLFSIKVINKAMVKQDNIIEQLIKQTKIQSFLNHSHIVKLYSVFDDHQNVYLLMELCCEGNLYEYMQKKGKIQEEEAGQFMREACQAVGELHFHKIIHRDIKPENIVLCFGMAKICDFGWSTEIKGNMRETFCGSPLYISPQLLKGQLYDQKVDLWALGILGYELITGNIPFQIVTEKDLVKIINSRIVYPSWMSPVTVSFLQELLEKNPENRASIQQLLEHPFLCRQQQTQLHR